MKATMLKKTDYLQLRKSNTISQQYSGPEDTME